MVRKIAVAAACVAIVVAAACSSSPKAASPSPPGSGSPSPAASPRASPSPATSPSPSATASPAPRASSITFVSLSQAWALATQGGTPVVLHTTDRGQHWADVASLASVTGVGGAPYTHIRFADATDGWAWRDGPGLITTHDGGVSWHLVSSTLSVLDLEASGGTAWAVTETCTVPASSCGAGTAQLERSPATSDGFGPVGGFEPLPSTGGAEVALFGPAVYVLIPGATPVLRLSTDGTHFAGLAKPCPAGFGIGRIAVSSAHDLAVLCAGNAAAGSVSKVVFLSADSGATYHPVADAPLGGDPVDLAAATPTTFALAAASGASEVYRTTGSDTAWSTPLSFGDGGAGWADLGFTDASHGVVVYAPRASGVVYLTDDAGATWHPVTFKP